MRRTVVIGASGSGKTTLARAIADRLSLVHIELDAVHWKANWTSTPVEEMRPIVTALISGDGWTIDGNYLKVRDLVWSRADTLIWLDYPMSVVFTRVLRRTLARAWRREVLWNGNRERLWVQFCTSDSLLLWVINSWRRHRRDYPKLLREERYQHLRVLRFRSPRETEAWLQGLASPCVGAEHG